MSTSFDWHPSSKGKSVFKVETRNLGWWVLLAVLVSVVVHCALYVILSGIERRGSAQGDETIVWRNQREQITIDRDKLNELLNEAVLPDAEEAIEPEKVSDLELTDQSLDEFDLLEQLQEETVRLAPFETPQIFSQQAPKAPSEALGLAAGGLDISASEFLSQDLNQMRDQLIESSAAISVAQPRLELNQSDDDGSEVDVDAFFKEAAAKALGNGADELIEGYATLDDLIGRTGGLAVGEEKIALPTDILFEYNEHELKEEARLSMMKLAFIVQTNPDAVFTIEGHTDSFGGEEFNRRLSAKRADAVRAWLVDRLRIDASNIRTVGMGKSRPIVSTSGTADEQALNRRVEIVVKKS